MANIQDVFTGIIYTILAVFGGIAKYLNSYLKEPDKFSWCKLLAMVFISGFSGYMFASFIELANPELAKIGAGVGGFIGTQALDYLANVLKKK